MLTAFGKSDSPKVGLDSDTAEEKKIFSQVLFAKIAQLYYGLLPFVHTVRLFAKLANAFVNFYLGTTEHRYVFFSSAVGVYRVIVSSLGL